MEHLTNPVYMQAVLRRHGFRFQKKYGQNFLMNEGVLQSMVDAAGVTKDDFILEIGPGMGTLTQVLSERAGKVLAVEPEQPITSLEDLIKALSQPKQKPQPHVVTTPPQLPPQPAPQRSIAIEPPENEGQRATAITAAPDDVYSQPADRLPSSSHDWRRAVIAHEILKRKF